MSLSFLERPVNNLGFKVVMMGAVYSLLLDFVMNVLKSKLISVYNYLYELSVTLLTQMTVLTYYEK